MNRSNKLSERLLKAGFPEGPDFGKAKEFLSNNYKITDEELLEWVLENKPEDKMKLQDPPKLVINLDVNNEEEEINKENVIEMMLEAMKTPTVVSGVIMPDACPAGSKGTIPVGGVIGTKNTIHPGMHSSDICCSLMLTEFKNASPEDVFNNFCKITHFGQGGRINGNRFSLPTKIYESMKNNSFLSSNKSIKFATEHLGTQGDGNHFGFVGVNRAGNTCLVTHHGSRGLGAFLYKKGISEAVKYTNKIAEGVLKQNAWLDFNTEIGKSYWEALQIIRDWTKENHSCLHNMIADYTGTQILSRVWNEHNFVFKEDDIFYHAKGATPIHNEFMKDSSGVQILPLSMKDNILIIKGDRNERNLGFAPHGAGRNISRRAHRKNKVSDYYAKSCTEEFIKNDEDNFNLGTFLNETKELDVRFFSGNIDITELPSAYKSADTIKNSMYKYNLATVVDEIKPYGSIMAGDIDKYAYYRTKK